MPGKNLVPSLLCTSERQKEKLAATLCLSFCLPGRQEGLGRSRQPPPPGPEAVARPRTQSPPALGLPR